MNDRLARVAAIEPQASPTVTELISAFSKLRIQNARAIGALSSSYGISPTDLRAVSFVSVNGGVTPKQGAEHLGLTTGATTTLVDRLESAKLVKRGANPTDRRSVIIRLTPQGAAMMAEVNALYERAFQTAFDDDEIPRMREAFLALAEALGGIASSRGASTGSGAAAD